ncbi:MAG: hypothetical protein KF800_15390 [Lysobacter sp.]|nr:hypothetical protein [Lysobacter sp.]
MLKRFAPVLFAACLVSTPAIAQEDLDDRLLMNCSFRPRDATTQADGTYNVAFVSGMTNTASGNVNDLRLQKNTTSPASRRNFSMIWQGWNSTHGNQWFITPDFSASCLGVRSGYVAALTCSDNTWWYLSLDEGYYVIHKNSDKTKAWQAPTSTATSGSYFPWATFNASAPLSERRRFHWTITDCRDVYGNGVSPAS